MKKTYLFYDIETTGLNPAFDQVLQFAAIRTDEELKEISRHEIFVRLRPDVLPAPHAIITHYLGINDMQKGDTEIEAIKKIHQLFNEPGTITVGYNTLGFDDEFLRFSYYRNLLPPYTHQYANQCSRMDIYPIIIFYYLFAPDTLKWPLKNEKLSLKLEELIKTNNLIEGQAHNAMVDVEATLILARLLQKNKKIWDYCCNYFNKVNELDRLSEWKILNGDNIGLYIDPSLGIANNFLAPVLCLGQHRHYKNQFLFLRLDQEQLQQTRLDNLTENTWVFRKKIAEPGFLLPASDRYLAKLTAERIKTLEENKKWIKDNPSIFQKIMHHYLDYKYPFVPEADVDSALYQNGFLANEDEVRCRLFHQANVAEKIAMLDEFSSHELQEMAQRLLGRYYYEQLPAELQEEFASYLAMAITEKELDAQVDYRHERKLSKEKVRALIEEIRAGGNINTKQAELLDQYEAWLR